MKVSNFQKVLIVLILLGAILFINRVLLGDALSKEEAQHALYGLSLTGDIRAFDWGSFWYDTQRQMYWPFLHSWIQSVFFLIFGVSGVSARGLSVVLFVAVLVMIYDACVRFSEASGRRIGILSVALALSSPLMVRYGFENTLEVLGAFLFLLVFYLYSVTEEKRLTIEYVFIAVLIGLSIYTNYLYAYLMIPAFIVMTLGKLGPLFFNVIRLKRKGEKAAVPFFFWAYRKLLVIAVLTVMVGAWFFTPTFSRKVMLLLQAIFRYSGGEANLGFWQSVAFYPKVIISQFSFSPWIGALMFISLFFPFVAFHYRQTGKLYTFIWTVIILATMTIPTKAPQIIYIIAPFVFIVFSAAVFYVLENWKKHANVGLAIAVLLLPAMVSFPRLFELYFPDRPAESMTQVMDYFRRGVLPRNSIAASINLQRLNPEGIAFHFWDWSAPVLVDSIIGPDEMFRGAQYLLAVELDSSSPYQAEVLDDSVHRWNAFLSDKLRLGEVREYSLRRFEKIGLTAKIYEKTAQ